MKMMSNVNKNMKLSSHENMNNSNKSLRTPLKSFYSETSQKVFMNEMVFVCMYIFLLFYLTLDDISTQIKRVLFGDSYCKRMTFIFLQKKVGLVGKCKTFNKMTT